MSIITILNSPVEEIPNSEKLNQIADIVAAARKSYGNDSDDVKIESPMVNTTNGNMEFDNLDADSKVATLQGIAAKLKAQALEAARQKPGTNVDKKIEELIATNPYFVNIEPGRKFAYL